MSKWKPEVGETYYAPWLVDYEVEGIIWNNFPWDEARYNAGVVCRTKEEAIELAQKLLAVAKDGPANDRDKPLIAYRHVYDNGRIECPKRSREFVWGYYDGEGYDEISYCPYCGQGINVVDAEDEEDYEDE